jgi:hypothetical protein
MKEKLARNITKRLKENFSISLKDICDRVLFDNILCAINDSGAMIYERIPAEKPPLGIMPEKLWKEQRIAELIDCLCRYKEKIYAPSIKNWIDELNRLVKEVPNLKI